MIPIEDASERSARSDEVDLKNPFSLIRMRGTFGVRTGPTTQYEHWGGLSQGGSLRFVPPARHHRSLLSPFFTRDQRRMDTCATHKLGLGFRLRSDEPLSSLSFCIDTCVRKRVLSLPVESHPGGMPLISKWVRQLDQLVNPTCCHIEIWSALFI